MKEKNDEKITINYAEKHYSELLKYFENNPTFFNEGDLEHFWLSNQKWTLLEIHQLSNRH